METDFNTVVTAAEAFLAQMRREWIRENPGKECPVKTLDAYQGFHRGALLRSIQLAITAARSASNARN